MSRYFTTSEVAQRPESIFWLEKGQTGKTTMEDIQDALGEYRNNFDAGNASKAEIMTLHRAFPDSPTYQQAAVGIQKMDMVEPLVIGGPASVEMIDREGHLITTQALGKAFQKFMDNQRTRNVMVLHSDVQVGWALPAYISKGGQIFKSGVGDQGLFFICELRDDTAIAKKVADQINTGMLKSYSIAGSATKVQNMMKGQTPYMQVDEMELAEVTICEKGVNQGANFELLKAELPQTGKVDKDQCGYRDATAPEMQMGINCGHCKYFNAERKTCEVVVGDIQPGDYCRLFEACEEGSQPHVSIKRKIVIMRSDDTGKINFKDSFLDWMSKEEDPLKSGKSFTTLNNFAGREAEHHRLLQRYGFPSEVDMRTMRYIPVSETETDDDGCPINVRPPWVVNEAGENLGERLDNDDDLKKSINLFEDIMQKAAKRMGKANPGQAFPEGENPDKTGETMGVSAWQPQVNYGAPNPYNVKNPAGTQPVQTEQGRRNESPIGAGEADLMRDYQRPTPLPTSGPTSPYNPEMYAPKDRAAALREANVDQAPFPGASPAGVRARAAAPSAEPTAEEGEGERGKKPGVWGRFKNLFRRPQQDDAVGSQALREKIRGVPDDDADTQAGRRRDDTRISPAQGRAVRTPVEDQPRGGRQPLQGPGIRYRRGEDEPGQTAARNRADAAREGRERRGGRKEYDADEIVAGVRGRRGYEGRRDRMANLSPREKAHQGMKRLFRGGRQKYREADQNLRDLRGEVGGVAENIGRGFRDESMNEGKGAAWANQEARKIGRGARRGAEFAGGAFRGFMKPREDVRPDLPVSDHPASVLGETDNRLGAGSRERGGQVGRMARQWLGRGARAARGFGRGFMEDPEDARRVGQPRRYMPDELGATRRQADEAGMRGRGAGAKLRGWLDENVGRGQELVGEGVDRIPRYGRLAQQQRRMGVNEGVGKDVRYSPTAHQGMDADQRHNHVQERLDHINEGGRLSPKDWMSVIHHLGQTEDGDRFANHHSINMSNDDWNKPINFADMRQHLGRNMQVHHGRHGGAGAEAYDAILNRLGDSNEFGRSIELKRLRGDRPSMDGLARQEPTQESTEEERTAAHTGVRGPQDYGRRTSRPTPRGDARRPAWAQDREPIKYSVENSVPVHKIFAKAFGLAGTRR